MAPRNSAATMPAEPRQTAEQKLAPIVNSPAPDAPPAAAPPPAADPGQFAPGDFSAQTGRARGEHGHFVSKQDELDEASSKLEDEALEKILKPDAPEDRPQREKPPARTERDEDEDETNTAPAKADAEKTTVERTPEQQVALTKAIQALKFDRWKQSEIDELSDEQILDRGSRAAARQDEVNQGLERLNQSQPEKETAPTNGHVEDAKGQPATAQPDPYVAAAKAFADAAGEEYGKPLAEFGRSIAAPFESALMQLVQHVVGQTQRADALEGKLFDYAFKDAKAGLVELFPQIKDPSNAAKFKAKARELERSGNYESTEEAASMAGLILFGRQALSEAAVAKGLSRSKRQVGQPTLGEPVQIASRPLTQDQMEDRAAQLAAQGKSKRQIKGELGLR